jgi:hypothetical protein
MPCRDRVAPDSACTKVPKWRVTAPLAGQVRPGAGIAIVSTSARSAASRAAPASTRTSSSASSCTSLRSIASRWRAAARRRRAAMRTAGSTHGDACGSRSRRYAARARDARIAVRLSSLPVTVVRVFAATSCCASS